MALLEIEEADLSSDGELLQHTDVNVKVNVNA